MDAAVAHAYAWPATLPDDELLTRLVALNAERVAEEQTGHVRWLRPSYQHPTGTQTAFATAAAPVATAAIPTERLDWPGALPEQARIVRQLLAAEAEPVTAAALAARFVTAPESVLTGWLVTLAALGHAREVEDGRYAV